MCSCETCAACGIQAHTDSDVDIQARPPPPAQELGTLSENRHHIIDDLLREAKEVRVVPDWES